MSAYKVTCWLFYTVGKPAFPPRSFADAIQGKILEGLLSLSRRLA
jgi:hypothetical protein